MALKHSHLLFVALSVGFFLIRFIGREAGANFVRGKFCKIAPHVIDTLLLATGVGLVVVVGYPLWPVNWLTVKLALVVSYILLGVIALKSTRKTPSRVAAALAIACILAIGHLAVSKAF
ncbi:SirB2 family protein [Gilvimarinus xylanilyticus]|uniref:SirB2 family protein n=1 Tax=Gilvimarinus xylanilyticus TaxID=2944139 RepID=A0A9X2KT03_9GAMM|nr:SirB2 family protein [Gilvimarinus xylanilyticus]MCP8898677.1 SirB2 family protein [Gilvimarinus xylanilyticus]